MTNHVTSKFDKLKKNYNPYRLLSIPEGWRYIVLGESGDFINGLNKEKEDYGHGCHHVNIDNIFEGFSINTNNLGKVNASENEIKRYSLSRGDICLNSFLQIGKYNSDINMITLWFGILTSSIKPRMIRVKA